MTELELQQYLLRTYPQENERCDWKEMKNLKNSFTGKEGDDVISYVSGIANMEGGELVIGVEDGTLNIVGTDTYNFTPQSAVMRLVRQCANLVSEGLAIDEFVTDDTQKKVWVIHIPKHKAKLPVYAHNQAWQRIKDSLVQITPERVNAILEEVSPLFDWSAGLVDGATIDDLEPMALAKARNEFKAVHPRLAEEVDTWDDMTFLGHAGAATNGKINRAGMLLLSKSHNAYMLSPAVATITWILIDANGDKIDYEHFGTPFVLTVDEALSKIRNLNQRILPGGTLFPDIVKQYDDYSLREILHNCIAHQDYTMQQRVTMLETPESITFSNGGFFLPGTVRNAIEYNSPQMFYRNQTLCNVMVAFNMIDTIGRGIKKVFTEQQKRFFPMPDYIIDQANKKVTVKIYGKLIDEVYYRLLKSNPKLSLSDCIALDAVQKHETIDKDIAKHLRSLHLIEGRYPKLYLSLKVAKTSNNEDIKTDYIKNKGFNDAHYKEMILSYLKSFGSASRSELNTLLFSKLSEVLTDEQKTRKVGNLLAALRKDGLIKLAEQKMWVLVEL